MGIAKRSAGDNGSTPLCGRGKYQFDSDTLHWIKFNGLMVFD